MAMVPLELPRPVDGQVECAERPHQVRVLEPLRVPEFARDYRSWHRPNAGTVATALLQPSISHSIRPST